jgi:hypothetical protein
MLAMLHLLGTFVANLFKSRRRLEVENLFLRHQLNIALRRSPHRLRLRRSDRALLVWMTWLWPSLLGLSRVIQPDTILRWHRAGFRAYWRWKSRAQSGRPPVSRELRELIRRTTSDCQVASQPTHISLWLGAHSGLPDPRPGCLLWQSVRSAGSVPRHSRSSDITAFALAEWLCGAPDRFDPLGMSRPCCGVRRAAPAAFAAVAFVAAEACANPPRRPDRRSDVGRAHLGWTATPISPRVSFRQ